MSSLYYYDKQNQKGTFKLLAQKISQKLDSLAEITNIQERWVWQLIQNAKDAGNQFDKIRIKIQIHNDVLTFAHNGRLITPKDLNSIMNQYSAKEQENKDDIQTTGKYGTGFMTTYILSKKIRLQCRCLNIEIQSSSDQQQQIVKVQENISPGKKAKNSNQKSIVTNKKKIKEKKIKEKSKEQKYQNLNVNLDRQYNNVEELIKKLEKSKKQLRKQLYTSEILSCSERKQDSFDTKFIYQDLDDNSFDIIQKGIESLIYLFPYALLFNPKIYSIQIKNLSTKSKIQNIKIEREDVISIFGMYKILNVGFHNFQNKPNSNKKNTKNIKSFLYFQQKEINSIIAFPIEYTNNKISLLKFNSRYPQIFKEFPLIGSRNIGFNFAFTSKQFYPAETRKQLMLKNCYGRETNKTIKNWEIIKKIFKNLQQSLVLLTKNLQKGKFNLFVLPSPENHCFCEKQMQSNKFDAIISRVSRIIFQSKMFASKNYEKDKKMYSITEIFIPYYKANKKLSSEMNQLFSFLYQNKTLKTQQYQQLFEALNSNNVIFPQNLNFISLNNVIEKLSSESFQKVKGSFSTLDKGLQHLKLIYQYLSRFKKTIFSDKPLILTMELKFQSFYSQILEIQSDNLRLNQDFQHKQKYQQILQRLQINYNKFIIHHNYTDLFIPLIKSQMNEYYNKYNEQTKNKLKLVNFDKMIFANAKWYISKILNFFQEQKDFYNEEQSIKYLLILGKVILSFNIQQSPSLKFALKMKSLRQIRHRFISQKIEVNQIYKKTLQTLVNKFDNQFVKLIVKIYNRSINMEIFSSYFIQKRLQFSYQILNLDLKLQIYFNIKLLFFYYHVLVVFQQVKYSWSYVLINHLIYQFIQIIKLFFVNIRVNQLVIVNNHDVYSFIHFPIALLTFFFRVKLYLLIGKDGIAVRGRQFNRFVCLLLYLIFIILVNNIYHCSYLEILMFLGSFIVIYYDFHRQVDLIFILLEKEYQFYFNIQLFFYQIILSLYYIIVPIFLYFHLSYFKIIIHQFFSIYPPYHLSSSLKPHLIFQFIHLIFIISFSNY